VKVPELLYKPETERREDGATTVAPEPTTKFVVDACVALKVFVLAPVNATLANALVPVATPAIVCADELAKVVVPVMNCAVRLFV
jgi:hypothetical protein